MDRFPRSEFNSAGAIRLQTYIWRKCMADDGRIVTDRVYRVVCG